MSFIQDALNHKKKKNLAKGNNQNVLIYKRTAVEFQWQWERIQLIHESNACTKNSVTSKAWGNLSKMTVEKEKKIFFRYFFRKITPAIYRVRD